MTRRATAGAAAACAAVSLLVAAVACGAGGAGTVRGALDPVALTLLPPLARVPALVGRDGALHPVAGREDGRLVRDWAVAGDAVTFRRGPRTETVPLAALQHAPDGAPRVRGLFFALGTDRFGRDLATRLAQGALVSLGLALAATLGAAALALAAALAAAFGGRAADALLGAVGDLFLSVPRVLLVMTLAALVRPGPAGVALLLAATGWAGMARLLRAEARVLRTSDVVAAARATGATPLRVLGAHVLPHLGGTLAVAVALRFGSFLLLEASLSFLGFGIAPPLPSLGGILAEGRDVLFEAWWVAALPGVLLVLTVLGANRLADRVTARG